MQNHTESIGNFIARLAVARARAEPRNLQLSARLAFESRWWALLSCAQQDSLAATLVDDGILLLDGHDASLPLVADVMVDEAFRVGAGCLLRAAS